MSKKGKTIIIVAVGVLAAAAVLIILITASLKKETFPVPGPEMKVGDIVSFGEYQGQAVEWLVLEKDAEKALLISRYALDARAYHDGWQPVTWEKAALRKWMNSVMNNENISPEERVSIAYGMSIYEGAPETIDDCIKRADETMYETKKKMKGSVR